MFTGKVFVLNQTNVEKAGQFLQHNVLPNFDFKFPKQNLFFLKYIEFWREKLLTLYTRVIEIELNLLGWNQGHVYKLMPKNNHKNERS